MTTIEQIVRELRGFDANATVAKALRKELAKPGPAVAKRVRARALATLPGGGGLGAWAAATKITTRIKISGRVVTVTMRGGRSSKTGKKSDIKRLDAGRVRHPSWGRRGRGQWHTQNVPAGFFTIPVTQADDWRAACAAAVDRAFEELGRG